MFFSIGSLIPPPYKSMFCTLSLTLPNMDSPLVTHLIGKYNHSAPTYQNGSYYCVVHFFTTRQKKHPSSQISVNDSQFQFLHMTSNICTKQK